MLAAVAAGMGYIAVPGPESRGDPRLRSTTALLGSLAEFDVLGDRLQSGGAS